MRFRNTPMPRHASQIETRAGLSLSFTYRSHGNTFHTYLYVRVEGMCREREREGEGEGEKESDSERGRAGERELCFFFRGERV